MRLRSIDGSTPKQPRIGRLPSAIFSAIESAGTMRNSCGMVTMPAAIASCGEAKTRGSPAISMLPLSARCTPPRMRMSVDLPAPFSPTSAWISPKSSEKST